MKTTINTPKVTISTIGQYRAKPQNKPLYLQYIPIIIIVFQNLISINPITHEIDRTN